MAGSATLGSNLIDKLVPTVDRLRGSLNRMFGTRQFNMQAVKRTWLGASQRVGDGDFHDEVTDITPAPSIPLWNGYKWVMLAGGYHEDGIIPVTEVSLSYTYEQLTGGEMQKNQQFFFRLVDAHGQGQQDRILRNSKPPYVDREKTIGWVLILMDMNLPRAAGVEVDP